MNTISEDAENNNSDLQDFSIDDSAITSAVVADSNHSPADEAELILEDAPKGDYQELFVAFIDLLGFSQIVMRTSSHSGHADPTGFRRATREEIFAALSSIPADDYRSLFRARYLDDTYTDSQLQLGVAGFSDTIMFWADMRPETFGLLVHAIFQTVRQFTLRGFYCRGGIKLGEVLVDSTGYKSGHRASPIIFGPAVIQAYKLEQRNAESARTILCNNSTQFLNNSCLTSPVPELLRGFFNDYLFQSADGPWQIDIFADLRAPLEQESETVKNTIATISDKLSRVMAEYTESPAVFRKLLMLAKSFNSALDEAHKRPNFDFMKNYVIALPKGR